MATDVEIRKPFVPLLDDALFLYRISIEQNGEERSLLQFTLARHSILAAAMSVEAAANSCLDMLRLRGKTQEDLERLTVLGKYDVYLLSRGKGRIMDRGHAAVQPIRELKSLRDNLLHPKAISRVYTKLPGGGAFRNLTMYEHLGVIRDKEWSSDDAKTVLQKTVVFLRHFFVELCEHSPEESMKILCGEAKNGGGETVYEDLSEKGRETSGSLGMDLSFLGLLRNGMAGTSGSSPQISPIGAD